MGNSSQEARKEYEVISEKLEYVGSPYYVRSKRNSVELEEFLIQGTVRDIQEESVIYAMRSSSCSHNLVVVFDHFIVEQFRKVFLVQVEKMVCRLSHMGKVLNYLEALCITEAALNGFNQLIRHSKVAFAVTDRMVGINQLGQVRVWGNQNFAINHIQNGQSVRSESVMINELAATVAGHVYEQDQKSYENTRIQLAQHFSLFEAKMKISKLLDGSNRKQILAQLFLKIQPQPANKELMSDKTPIKTLQSLKDSIIHRYPVSLRKLNQDKVEENQKALNKVVNSFKMQGQAARDQTPPTLTKRKKIFNMHPHSDKKLTPLKSPGGDVYRKSPNIFKNRHSEHISPAKPSSKNNANETQEQKTLSIQTEGSIQKKQILKPSKKIGASISPSSINQELLSLTHQKKTKIYQNQQNHPQTLFHSTTHLPLNRIEKKGTNFSIFQLHQKKEKITTEHQNKSQQQHKSKRNQNQVKNPSAMFDDEYRKV